MEWFKGWMLNMMNGPYLWDFIIMGILMLFIFLIYIRGNRWNMRKLPATDAMFGFVMIYADQKGSGKKDDDFGRLLYSAEHDLQGKPDYIFRKRFSKTIVPVEMKSGLIKDSEEPHQGDLLQLGAYFLIIEDVYKKRPKYGKLIYQDYMFVIKNTRSLRAMVMATAKDMREMLEIGMGKPNDSFATCRYCICNGTVCKYSDTEIFGGNEDGPSDNEE